MKLTEGRQYHSILSTCYLVILRIHHEADDYYKVKYMFANKLTKRIELGPTNGKIYKCNIGHLLKGKHEGF